MSETLKSLLVTKIVFTSVICYCLSALVSLAPQAFLTVAIGPLTTRRL
jgi:hypothetical protein